MRNWLRVSGLLAIFLLPLALKGQLLCIDARNGRSTEGDCSCEGEKVSLNLTIAKSVKVTGALFDVTGAPIQYNESIIEVRDPLKNKILSSVVLDEQARFDLGVVPEGTYRLVTYKKNGKKTSRLPLFDQPKLMFCSGESECKLRIVLTIHGTDQPYEFCPPK
ncbi:MAG: hypothetical protein ABR905_13960 [Terracidiphilus sp.]|jgi:hypothetical protein